MQNTKVTNNYINSFKNVIRLGYCEAYYLLQAFSERNGYTSGVYGWNADFYIFDYNTAICTGYRPTGNIRPDYDITEDYNEKARAIFENRNISSDEKSERLFNLLDEYINIVLANN